MRIVEMTDLYHPAIGGLERVVQLLSEHLVRRGHTVHVVTSARPETPREEILNDVHVHRLPLLQQQLAPGLSADAGWPFHVPAPDPYFMWHLSKTMARVQPHVIHSHSWNAFSALARRAGPPVMITAHDYSHVCAKKTLVNQAQEICPGPAPGRCVPCASDNYGRAKGSLLALGSLGSLHLLGRVSRLTAVSDYVADRLRPIVQRVADLPVTTLRNFVPDGLYEQGSSAERPAFLPPEDNFLLFVGQLSRHKGIDVLLSAYRRLHCPPPLVLLGTPHPSSPKPDDLPPGVIQIMNVRHEDVIASMVRAAAVVAPSVWPDPSPLTVSEAQVCGTPVVASRIGGIPEKVDEGRSGWLVPPGEVEPLAQRLQQLVADPDLAGRMGRHARLYARRFEAAEVVPLLENALWTTAHGLTTSAADRNSTGVATCTFAEELN